MTDAQEPRRPQPGEVWHYIWRGIDLGLHIATDEPDGPFVRLLHLGEYGKPTWYPDQSQHWVFVKDLGATKAKEFQVLGEAFLDAHMSRIAAKREHTKAKRLAIEEAADVAYCVFATQLQQELQK